MNLDAQQLSALNYLFTRVLGQIFLAPYSNPTFNEMPGAQKKILFYLDYRGPGRMSDLARQVSITMPAATAVVDKLVKSGLVSRENDPADRRVIIVALTASGRRTIRRVMHLHERRFEEILQRLPERKRAQLVAAFATVYELLSEIDTPDEHRTSHGKQ
jgi:DNA-binding MarR family transcriptional regulator